MNPLPPWTNGPFELIRHAEEHWLNGEDFDRRIALISFADAIEVAVTTYLTLHPIQRSGRAYPHADVTRWLENYHSRLDFLDSEIRARGGEWEVDRAHIVWVHQHRNEQYHGGNTGTPEKNLLVLARKTALWVFGYLFEVPDAEEALAASITRQSPVVPQPDRAFDRAIDQQFGMVEIGDQPYYASEILFNVDGDAYRDWGTKLCDSGTPATDGEPGK